MEVRETPVIEDKVNIQILYLELGPDDSGKEWLNYKVKRKEKAPLCITGR